MIKRFKVSFVAVVIRAVTLKVLITTAADDLFIFFLFSDKIRLDALHEMPSFIFSK